MQERVRMITRVSESERSSGQMITRVSESERSSGQRTASGSADSGERSSGQRTASGSADSGDNAEVMSCARSSSVCRRAVELSEGWVGRGQHV
jgi:hypothetical protein